tara:strand:- start:377 stop:727 length:351 start_codon:yes stop_codon:yes gene_type:complete
MSDKENVKNTGELSVSAESYTLDVCISLTSEGGLKASEVKTQATIPFLLMEEHILLAEPRVRKQLDSLVDSFKLLFAAKVNNLIEAVKTVQKPLGDESNNQNADGHPDIEIEEIGE